jgi:hypothetical protein
VAQGRDIGAAVTDAMASQAPDRPAGIHPELPAQAPLRAAALPPPLCAEEPALSRASIRTDQGDPNACHDRKPSGRHSNPAIHDPEGP